MSEGYPSSDAFVALVGAAYLLFGCLGFICNAATIVMIASNRVYRLSAYTLMANVALADSIILLMAGIFCGLDVLFPDIFYTERLDTVRLARSTQIFSDHSLMRMIESLNRTQAIDSPPFSHYFLAFSQISAWTAGVMSYALLGLNRCIAICYYGTRAKTLNRVSVAIVGSVATWCLGFAAAGMGTLPEPLIGIRRNMWSISITDIGGYRINAFVWFVMVLNIGAVIGQWVCSTLVLLKIRQVKKKISSNKLNQNSANRFRKQARLTFQFFYPSLLCTISTLVHFVKPFIYTSLPVWLIIFLHLITLFNHACNPFIYAYFNDRMRLTYKDMLTCASLRYYWRKRRASHPFRNNQRGASRRSHATGMKSARMSARSARSRDGNFVRNSLQMQSRDFEQLCEFIMRVNPLYDSSEGWRESSDDESQDLGPLETIREMHGGREERESKSIVLDLGRQTVEHWVKFAKKASI